MVLVVCPYMSNISHVYTMASLKDIVSKIEKKCIRDALEATNWVQVRAAKMLGITQGMLGYKIKKYGITIKPEQRRRKR